MPHKRTYTAFTLVELIVVITIIGILSAISVSSLSKAQQRTRDTQRKTQVVNFTSSLEQYKQTNGVYAPPWNVTSGNICQRVGGDTSGLGDCFHNVNYSGGPAGDDPAFTLDTSNACAPNCAAVSQYLIAFMSKPAVIGGSFTANMGNFPVGSNPASVGADLAAGVINYRAQNTYYMVRIVLENTGTIGTYNTGGSCNGTTNGNFKTSASVTDNNWREATYNIASANNNNCSAKVTKIFQKSSLTGL